MLLKEINRYVWDGNVLIHEWKYKLKDRPKLVIDGDDLVYDKQEPIDNLIAWIYEDGSFVPSAKIIGGNNFSIVSDYMGRPVQAYNELGNLVWETDYDIYGDLINSKGDRSFIPFRQLGQYEDIETSLYYNRFRYYSPETGLYLTQDPIRLFGGNRLYSYVHDSNAWVDPLGLIKAPSSVPNSSGVYTLTNPTTGEAYVGSGLDANSRMSDTSHTKAQSMLSHPDTKVDFTPVDLGDAKDWKSQNRILRHFEQQEFENVKNTGQYDMLNSNNPEAAIKKTRNAGIVKDKKASKGLKIKCK
ncbi:RHS repeat-associated core domain-containing protein [Flavobacterium sp. MMLR14_040]|uniref:RHS repeat domain-containing protein n=1 Tax=Flavobacterium sp. MMLR14_040 TaxID=3093843 RepID=UPI0029904C05|nr:RHS repeat-associated core domain-containing protein [Flavobacterium sp. MMLR14_040]MDW8852407.1 RHS repeat-associated core domain-containing protein [Flavobacterium sp. MMLR14_040]